MAVMMVYQMASLAYLVSIYEYGCQHVAYLNDSDVTRPTKLRD